MEAKLTKRVSEEERRYEHQQTETSPFCLKLYSSVLAPHRREASKSLVLAVVIIVGPNPR